MDSISNERGPSDGPEAARRRRQLGAAITASLRELSTQMSLLNHQVGTRLDLRSVDLNCLELIGRHGPLSPSDLARRTGLHPATLTGILDRLERGGWIARDRDPSDRRGVLIRTLRDRNAEVFRLYAGMSAALEQIYAGYADAELEVLADFVRRTADAGRTATGDLAGD